MRSTSGAVDRPGPVTLVDVARRAGVSEPTASRVLNGSTRRVRESYRRRVLEAAAELGYTPNVWAQVVARGSSRTIALVVSTIADPYFSFMASAIMRRAAAGEMRLSIAVTERSADREFDVVHEFRGQQPHSIILAGTAGPEVGRADDLIAELRRYEAAGGRVVLISRGDLPFESVSFDDRAGARDLGRQLAGLGYRSPLLLGSGTPLVSMEERVDGFLDGLAAGGVELPPDRILRPVFTWDGARSAITALDRATLRSVDLVFAVNDEMALGAIAGLRDRGVGLPDEVGVAGFDDITTLRDVVPALTTVHVELDVVAEEAIYRATTTDDPVRRRVIPAYPMLRASTPPRRRTGARKRGAGGR